MCLLMNVLGCKGPPKAVTEWVQIAPAGKTGWMVRSSNPDRFGVLGTSGHMTGHIDGGENIEVKTPRGVIALPNRRSGSCSSVRFAIIGDSRAEGPRVGLQHIGRGFSMK